MFKSRKFYIWLISLAAVLTVYLLYSRLSKTPQIKIDTQPETVDDSSFGDFDSEIGMVGDVGVGTVRVAKFITLNKDKSVDREFGFEKLLHKIGDEWEIEKPYMNVFRRGFKCHLTADKGKVQIEDAFGRPSPKDATLTGNVVIHILPENSSGIKESFIYLDDIVFNSEKTQFSTAGPVKFVSENAQMLGTGMELVYNDELNRLEFLRIVHLETLRLKTSEAGLFSSGQTRQTPVVRPVGTSGRAQTEPHAEPVASDIPQKAKTSPTVSQKVVEQTSGENYRCVFSKNVVIDGPEQLIFADQVSINDIFFSSAASEESGKADTGGADSVKSQDVTEETVSTDRIETHDVNAAKQAQPYKSPQEFADIIVTCDNGILVTPMNSTRKLDAVDIDRKIPKNFNNTSGRPTFVAQRIDYTESTGDTIASGPSELTFYTDVIGNETKQTAVPVKVTAREKVTFLPASNQVVFEGDCLCTMLREDPNVQQKYTLSAPKLTINLSRDKSGSDTNIEHLTASGGPVQLDTSKWAEEELLGFTKLKCRRFDYDAGQQMFLATGPDGIIAVDNSKIAQPKGEVSRFSLQRPSYAVVRDFETLKYSLEANRIIADAGRGQILIDYFPIANGRYTEQVSATAGLIEALLYEAAPGRTELSTLRATGGVTYQEQGKKKKWGKSKDIQFVGSEMFYDADKSLITAWGDELQPCLLNGALVDAIEYNLKTGKIKTKITGPGMLQMRR